MSITAEDVRAYQAEHGVGIMTAKAALVHKAHEAAHRDIPRSLNHHAADVLRVSRRVSRLELACLVLVAAEVIRLLARFL